MEQEKPAGGRREAASASGALQARGTSHRHRAPPARHRQGGASCDHAPGGYRDPCATKESVGFADGTGAQGSE